MSAKTDAAIASVLAEYAEKRRYLCERERAESALEKLPKRLRDDPATVWLDGFAEGYSEALAIFRDAIA